jgi:hypothetical protein
MAAVHQASCQKEFIRPHFDQKRHGLKMAFFRSAEKFLA